MPGSLHQIRILFGLIHQPRNPLENLQKKVANHNMDNMVFTLPSLGGLLPLYAIEVGISPVAFGGPEKTPASRRRAELS